MTYSFDHDQEVSAEIVLQPAALEPLQRELAETKVFAWDVETSGLDPWRRHIVGHAFAWRRPNRQVRAVYLPVRHRAMGAFDQVTQLPVDAVKAALSPALAGPGLKIGHGFQLDVKFGWREGYDPRGPVHETMVCAKLIEENHKSYKLSDCLARSAVPHKEGWKQELASELKQIGSWLGKSVKRVKEDHGYEYVSVATLGHYALQDAVYELRLAEWQQPYTTYWPDIWAMEMRLFWVCAGIGRIGVPVVPEMLHELARAQQARMDEMAPKIWQLAGGEQFEITNDSQIRRILFEKLGYASRGDTRGGIPRIDDDVLWDLEVNEKSQIAGLIRKYNSAQKVVSTYTLGVAAFADAQNIIHPEIDQAGAKTGRVSCRSPNLTNVPVRTELGRQVRAAFVARPGMVRYCLDWSQIELRILADRTQDPLLIKVYREGLDAHKTTALEVFGTADTVGGIDMRRMGKIINFGTSFGMTEWGLLKNTNKDLPPGQVPITEQQAKQFLADFYRRYAGIPAYRNALWYQVKQNGGLFQNMFGRPRRIPEISDKDEWRRKQAERETISSMIQGSAADLVKHTMVAVWDYLRSQTECEANMVLMVHDDLQFDMDPRGSAKVIREVKRLMEHTCQSKLSVPIVVDAEYFTTNWRDKRKMKGFQ